VRKGKRKAVSFAESPQKEEGVGARLDWHMSEEQAEEDAAAWADIAMEGSEVNTSGWDQ
jgi:hypothetical protein